MNNTKRLIYFTIYWICLSSLINRYIWNNPIITLLPDILVIVLFLHKPINIKNISQLIGRNITATLIILFTIGTLSAIINITPITCFLWGFRMLVRYPLLFYIIYQHFNIRDVFILKKNLYQSFWINAFFIVLQFFQGTTGDTMGGIWSGNGILAVYILISIIIYGKDYFLKEISLLNFLCRIIFFFICAAWGEIKMLYFIIPITIYITYCFYKKFNLTHILIIIIGYFTLMPLIQWGLSFYYNQDYIETLNMESLNEYNNGDYGFSGYSYNRGTCIKLATAQFLKDPFHLLFGHGIGSATVSTIFPSEIGSKYGSVTCYFFFTSSYALIELGWVGYVLYILFHLLLLYSFFKYYKQGNNIEIKNWAAAGCISTIITFIMIYYNSTPYIDYYPTYIFWSMCYIAIKYNKISTIHHKSESCTKYFNKKTNS